MMMNAPLPSEVLAAKRAWVTIWLAAGIVKLKHERPEAQEAS